MGGDTPALVVLSALGVQAGKAMKSKPLNNVASAPGPAPRFLLSFSDGLLPEINPPLPKLFMAVVFDRSTANPN